MTTRKSLVAILLACFYFFGAPNLRAESTIPQSINGVELETVKGWLACLYSYWPYKPEQSPTKPIPLLWTPYQAQSPAQVRFSAEELDKYGSGADVLEFNPNPDSPDLNAWKQIYLSQREPVDYIKRPFFLAYEHINGTRYRWTKDSSGQDAYIDMSDPYNRNIFKQDIDFMFQQVILPYSKHYITVNGRAVIYMWATAAMQGDFASLLEEVKNDYPVFFIGSIEALGPNDEYDLNRARSFDGFMDYSNVDPEGDYVRMTTSYFERVINLSKIIRKLEAQNPGKHWLLIPTFQFAYDDTLNRDRQYPDGTPKTPAMYGKTRDEPVSFAQMIQDGMYPDEYKIFDFRPFGVYSELFEGGALIQTWPQQEKDGEYHGYGTARLEIMKQFFGPDMVFTPRPPGLPSCTYCIPKLPRK